MTNVLFSCPTGAPTKLARTTVFAVVIACLNYCPACLGQNLFQQQMRGEEVFLLAPRPLVRLLREGERAIADGRYTDGILAIGALLQDDDESLPSDLRGQDFFLEEGKDGLYSLTIKGEASRLLAELPDEGRRVLEIELGVKARSELNQALADRDLPRVGGVARKFPHTEAGYDAELLVANYKLAAGFPMAAARIFQSLLDAPAARARYGAELAKATAVSWAHADLPERAIASLETAGRFFPSGSMELGGRQLALNENHDWESVLSSVPEFDRSRNRNRAAENWLVAGGAASRNATVKASLPLRNARWVKEIHSSVPEKKSLQELANAERQGDRIILPKFEVRSLGDLILAKTSDSEVLAVDFETGLTKWPIYMSSSPAKLMNLEFDSVRSEGAGGLSDELVNRVWGSSAFGRFSCDQERLYYLSEVAANRDSGRGIAPVDTNLLQGFSISAQGKIEWQVGGPEGINSEPRLQDAFFLGPPLSYEGDLFAIIERKAETRLVALDPATGKLRWSQQLVHPINSQLKYDPLRRSQALSPTVSEGVLLCPTGAGAIAAVDLLTRRLLWGFSYGPKIPRNISQFGRRGGAFGFAPVNYLPLDPRWQDTAMIAQDGILIASPAESDNYFVLKLDTGEQVVLPKPRGTARYIAGVRGQNLYIVGEREAYCLDMIESNIIWIEQFPDRHRLAGKGLWLEDSLMLPLTGNKLIKMSLEDGQVIGEAVVDEPLGNLFVHRGSLLSASATAVSAYHMQDELELQVAERLSGNPSDTWALNQQSQLILAKGEIDEALLVLTQSYELDPENVETRYLLVETLLEGIEKDFAKYAERANQFRSVVEFGPQRFRFLQWLALGSLQAGNEQAGFQNFMELMHERLGVLRSSIDSRANELRLSEGYSVDADNWIATSLARLYESSNDEQRQLMDQAVKQELASLSDFVTGRRRQTLEFFRWHPSASDALLDTAITLLNREDQSRAEKILVPFLESNDSTVRNVAAKLLEKRTTQDNLRFGPQGQAFPSAAERMAEQQDLDTVVDDVNETTDSTRPFEWNSGLLTAKVRQEGPRRYPQGMRLPMVAERYGRPEFDVKLSGGMLIISNMNGEDIGRLEFNRASADIDDEYARAYVRGGLLIVETSSEVVGIDLYRGLMDSRDAMLWRQSLLYPNASPNRAFSRAPKPPTASESLLGVPIAIRKTAGRKTAVGPLTPAGLILQLANNIALIDAYSGRKLWEREGYDGNVRIAADGLNLAVINPSLGQVEILDCRDGAALRQYDYRGDWEPWFAYKQIMVDYSTEQPPNAGNAGVNSSRTKRPIIRVWNTLTGEDIVPPLQLASGSKANVFEGRYLVVVEPSSTMHYFDLESNVYKQFETAVDAQLNSIHLERFGQTLVVLSNAGENQNNAFGTPPFLLKPVNGYVYAIDLQEHRLLWDRPGKLKEMMLPDAQPRNSPFMVAYRYGRLPNAQRNARPQAVGEALAIVDLRTGYLAYTARDIPLGQSDGFAMLLYPRSQSFEFTFGSSNFFLTATDMGRPPQPVFSYGHSYQALNRR